ncbi:MAG: hypothetical protein HY329_24650, partial [Chloroflexi bacterium]|nr:hypothetical protein [Chloroflexota bacterium]
MFKLQTELPGTSAKAKRVLAVPSAINRRARTPSRLATRVEWPTTIAATTHPNGGQQSGTRRMAVGADVQPAGVDFRVCAPGRRRVELVLDADGLGDLSFRMAPETGGYFSTFVSGARSGTRYGYRLDGEPQAFADPASRFQPDGPHGRSLVVDPDAYTWTDSAWSGVELPGQVIYE